MNADILLKHFDRISEAPDAIPRLRRFILDLAVRGKLVEQDPNDEPAAELLKRIQAEKVRLVKEGKINKQDLFEAPCEEVCPFQIPHSWTWVPATYPACLISDMGKKVQTKDVLESGMFPVVDQGKIFIRGYSNESEKVIHLETPVVLFGDHTRETKLIDFDFIVGADGVKLLLPVCIFTNYYYLALNWLPLDSRGYGRHFKLLKASALPLPPLAEQHHIVAKVDELMALCDQLETAKNEREARRDKLVASSLNRISTTTADDAKDAISFHLDNLSRLSTRPEHIKQLRQTILSLAVCGRLGQATECLTTSIKLGNVAKLQNGYAFKSEWFVPQGIRLLRNVNVGHGTLRWDELVCLPEDRADEFERFRLSEGDIVLSLDRPFITTGVKVARIKLIDLPCLLLQRVGRFQIDNDRLCADYLFLWLHSPDFTNQIDPGRSNGVPHVSSKQVETATIFVPPLAEQQRIVAKVDELMALCDQLEAQLSNTEADSRRLLEAVLRDALNTSAMTN